MNRMHYDILADLFYYPGVDFLEKVKIANSFLQKNYPLAYEELNSFYEATQDVEIIKIQELFTRSFDVQSATTLDIGYVLFGDDYKRGELLSNLNKEHVKAGIDCHSELADHLPNILRLLSKLTDEDLIHDLVHEILAPALAEMISEFDSKRLKEKKKSYKKHYKTLIVVDKKRETVYVDMLKMLELVLKKDFSIVEKEIPKQTIDFLKSVTEEMEIEGKA